MKLFLLFVTVLSFSAYAEPITSFAHITTKLRPQHRVIDSPERVFPVGSQTYFADQYGKGYLVEIIGRSRDADTLVIKFLEGPRIGVKDNVPKSYLALQGGCLLNICHRDNVHAYFYGSETVETGNVVGFTNELYTGSGKIVFFRATSGDRRTMGKVFHLPVSQIYTHYGCGTKELCIGDNVINELSGSRARYQRAIVTGVSGNGRYMIKYTTGVYKDKFKINYSYRDLVITEGCGFKFCVDDTVTETRVQGSSLKIFGVYFNGKYLGKFKIRRNRGRMAIKLVDENLKLIRRAE